jgi:S-adenosylmethionine hydrolase
MTSPIVTLLTDFGVADTYVAQVKGVILGINPAVILVDLTHEVPPQSVAVAAFLVSSALHAFPDGTIHLAVVDPGVGTERRPLLLVTPTATLVGPDNGIFSYVLQETGNILISGSTDGIPLPLGVQGYHLTNADYWRQPVSRTFHARDIFGPVAAHLSLGVPPQTLGQPVERVWRMALPELVREGQRIQGCVIHTDRFGNLITNVPGAEVTRRSIEVHIAGRRIKGLSTAYAEGGVNLLALVGSHGLLEISVRDGSAAALLGMGTGEPVRVEFLPTQT